MAEAEAFSAVAEAAAALPLVATLVYSAEAGLAALAADRRGSRAELAALTAASAVAASGVPGEASAAEASAVPEAVFGWAAGDGSQDPEAAPAAGSALPVRAVGV